MDSLLTPAHLEAGINLWRGQKAAWPSDFHNQLYRYLHRLKQHGLTDEWWQGVVPVLWNWRAVRPLSKAALADRGLQHLDALRDEHDRLTDALGGREPSLSTASWELASGLYGVARSIKGSRSPVFGSKLCHFILPGVFPVIDRDVVGLGGNGAGYADYWRFCQAQWSNCTIREALVGGLRQAIREDVAEHYPWSTKVTELCFIGSRAGRVAAAPSPAPAETAGPGRAGRDPAGARGTFGR